MEELPIVGLNYDEAFRDSGWRILELSFWVDNFRIVILGGEF